MWLYFNKNNCLCSLIVTFNELWWSDWKIWKPNGFFFRFDRTKTPYFLVIWRWAHLLFSLRTQKLHPLTIQIRALKWLGITSTLLVMWDQWSITSFLAKVMTQSLEHDNKKHGLALHSTQCATISSKSGKTSWSVFFFYCTTSQWHYHGTHDSLFWLAVMH